MGCTNLKNVVFECFRPTWSERFSTLPGGSGLAGLLLFAPAKGLGLGLLPRDEGGLRGADGAW